MLIMTFVDGTIFLKIIKNISKNMLNYNFCRWYHFLQNN